MPYVTGRRRVPRQSGPMDGAIFVRQMMVQVQVAQVSHPQPFDAFLVNQIGRAHV